MRAATALVEYASATAGNMSCMKFVFRSTQGRGVAERREPVEPERQRQQQQRAHPESGHGKADDREDTQEIVYPGVLSRCGNDPHRHGECYREEYRHERELECQGQARTHLFPDRAVGEERIAEVELHRAGDPLDVLYIDGGVQSETAAHPLQLLLRERALALVAGEHDERRVAGNDAQDDEDDKGHPNQCWEEQEHSTDYIGTHRSDFPCESIASFLASNRLGE